MDYLFKVYLYSNSYYALVVFNNIKMTVNRKHTEIFDQEHKMWAEGTSIGNNKELKPKKADIKNYWSMKDLKSMK